LMVRQWRHWCAFSPQYLWGGGGGGQCGVWCVVCGVWCVVCGVWCVVCGVWCVVCGVWHVLLSTYSAQSQTCAAQHLLSSVSNMAYTSRPTCRCRAAPG
jgi:hypothetical protein